MFNDLPLIWFSLTSSRRLTLLSQIYNSYDFPFDMTMIFLSEWNEHPFGMMRTKSGCNSPVISPLWWFFANDNMTVPSEWLQKCPSFSKAAQEIEAPAPPNFFTLLKLFSKNIAFFTCQRQSPVSYSLCHNRKDEISRKEECLWHLRKNKERSEMRTRQGI